MKRLTGTSNKMLKAMINADAQYEVYKRLEYIENILDSYGLEPEDIQKALNRLAVLETIMSGIGNYKCKKLFDESEVKDSV